MVVRTLVDVMLVVVGAIFVFGRENLAEGWGEAQGVKERDRWQLGCVGALCGSGFALAGVVDLVLAALGRPGLFGLG